MKTLKIFLNEDGSIKDFSQDFKINQYSFQDTLLNVYVPSNVIDNAISNNLADAETISYGTSIQMGLVYTNPNGSTKVGTKYLFSFVKEVSINGISYTLYERLMPKEFTLLSGDNTYSINVVNTKTTTADNISTTVVTNLITSGTYTMYITKSVNFGNETEEASEYDSIIAQLNSLIAKLEAKQDKVDNDLTTTTKNVVEALNSINDLSNSNATQITINTNNISKNASDIQWLEDNILVNETLVGYIEKDAEPNASDLDAYVLETLSREAKQGDAVIWTYIISGDTDIAYKCVRSSKEWGWFKIPSVESASNTDKGIVKGNLTDTYAPVRVDVANGEIKGVYVRDDIVLADNTINKTAISGTSQNLTSTTIAYMLAILKSLINLGFYYDENAYLYGTTPKAKIALKAEADGNGKNISETYMTNSLGASKQFVKDYALPRDFNDTYYITSGGYVADIPTKSEAQFSKTISSIGYSTLFELDKYFNTEFELSKKNSAKTTIYIKANRATQIQLLLTTTLLTDSENYNLSSVLSGVLSLSANGITKVDFDDAFSLLTEEIKVNNKNTLTQKLEVLSTESTSTTFEIYSNETYPSSFNLNTFTQINYNQFGDLGEYEVIDLIVDTAKDISSTSISFMSNADITLNKNTNVLLNFTDLLSYKETIGTNADGSTTINSISINGISYSFASGDKTLQNLNNLYSRYVNGSTPYTYLIVREINSVLFLDDFIGASSGDSLWINGSTSNIIQPKTTDNTVKVNNFIALGETSLVSPSISGIASVSGLHSPATMNIQGVNGIDLVVGEGDSAKTALSIASDGTISGISSGASDRLIADSAYETVDADTISPDKSNLLYTSWVRGNSGLYGPVITMRNSGTSLVQLHFQYQNNYKMLYIRGGDYYKNEIYWTDWHALADCNITNSFNKATTFYDTIYVKQIENTNDDETTVNGKYKINSTNTFTGTNNFTGTIQKNGSDISAIKVAEMTKVDLEDINVEKILKIEYVYYNTTSEGTVHEQCTYETDANGTYASVIRNYKGEIVDGPFRVTYFE